MVEANTSAVLDSDRLPDPMNDRQVPSVKAPPNVPLGIDRVFPNDCQNSEINLDLVNHYLYEGGKISKECLLEIMRRVKPVLSDEPNLVRITGKVVICGDIHGQFYDLVAMLRKLKVGFRQLFVNF